MHNNLLNSLVEKNVISAGSEIEVRYLARGLDGNFRELVQDVFTIREIHKLSSGLISLICFRNRDGAELKTGADAIVKIDGMDPADLGRAFDIMPDGKMRTVKLDEFGNPVRRGRKKKVRQ